MTRTLRVSITIALALLCAPAHAADKWVTSWVASVQGPYPVGNPSAQPVLKFAFPAPEAGARDQTFRLIVMPDIFIIAHRQEIIALSAQFRLPAVYTYRLFPVSGGLMSYGTDLVDLFRRAASYVDRILKGEKPADLPVQMPVKYELVINLKTAKAFGLEIPMPVQQRADEVIE